MADWWPLAGLVCRPPDKSRVVARFGDQRRSHADLVRLVGRWQAAFATTAQSEWAIYLEDPFEFVAAILGAWHADKTVALPGDNLPGTLQALREAGIAMAGDLPDGLQASAAADAATQRLPIDVRAAQVKVYTSGSQGRPEAIVKRLDQLVSEVQALETAFGAMLDGNASAEGQATIWATVSHQHIYGLLFLVLWPLCAGRPISPRRLLYAEEIAACLGPQPSVLVATPAHLKRLGDLHDWRSARQGLRAIFSSGGPLPFEVSKVVGQLLGHVPIEVFGSSETGGIAWRQCAVADQPWQPFGDVSWQLDGDCLAVRSPRLPNDEWWTTSDRVEAAGGASFRLLGRADRIVKIEEKRVSLSAIEQGLLATAWVREVKALVVDTPIGTRVAAVIVPTDSGRQLQASGRRALVEALRSALAGIVEGIALPRRWRFVEALPINAQGKSPESLLAALFVDPVADEVVEPAVEPIVAGLPDVRWIQRSATDAVATLHIPADLALFDGHFEVAPILPGVAQLDWALALGRACFTIPERFVRLEALKFVRPVKPNTELTVVLQFKPALEDPDLCRLSFRWYSKEDAAEAQQDHASGRAVWSYSNEAPHA
jgi:acyl-coenzyme A synthetase/AMP-(fatty) acid ligase